MKLSEAETRRLEKAKEANPWWFEAVMLAAEVMPARRKKYSGDIDPFTNFHLVARRRGVQTIDVFPWYIDIKAARAEVGNGNFEDESFTDTLRDQANYTLLWLGYVLQQKEVRYE